MGHSLPESLSLHLRRSVGHDFRNAFVIAYLSGNADALPSVGRFRIAKFRAVTSPNEECKNLIGIRLVEVQKRRASPSAFRVSRAHYLPANGSLLTNVILGFGRRERLLRQRG